MHTNRWGQARIVEPKRKLTESKEVAYMNRIIKRANAAAGYEVRKAPKTWHYSFESITLTGRVVAMTKSEARAKIKKQLSLGKKDRLPVSIHIREVTDGED